jgi:hypothetical protein
MDDITLNDFGMSRAELDEKISVREAYLSMFEFLRTHWEGCGDYELGAILGTLSLWNNTRGGKAPMDSSILPDWLNSVRVVREAQKSEAGYRGADIELKK